MQLSAGFRSTGNADKQSTVEIKITPAVELNRKSLEIRIFRNSLRSKLE